MSNILKAFAMALIITGLMSCAVTAVFYVAYGLFLVYNHMLTVTLEILQG